MNSIFRLLLLDEGNAQQSQMLERMLQDVDLPEHVMVTSAGFAPKTEINRWVILGMEQNNKSVVKGFPKHLSHFQGIEYDLVVELESPNWIECNSIKVNCLKKINLVSHYDIEFVSEIQNKAEFNEIYEKLLLIVDDLVAKINKRIV